MYFLGRPQWFPVRSRYLLTTSDYIGHTRTLLGTLLTGSDRLPPRYHPHDLTSLTPSLFLSFARSCVLARTLLLFPYTDCFYRFHVFFSLSLLGGSLLSLVSSFSSTSFSSSSSVPLFFHDLYSSLIFVPSLQTLLSSIFSHCHFLRPSFLPSLVV